jgi:hypothetical protein
MLTSRKADGDFDGLDDIMDLDGCITRGEFLSVSCHGSTWRPAHTSPASLPQPPHTSPVDKDRGLEIPPQDTRFDLLQVSGAQLNHAHDQAHLLQSPMLVLLL